MFFKPHYDNKKPLILYILFVYTLLNASPLFCQIEFNKALSPSIQLNSNFNKQNVTWNWNGIFQTIHDESNGFSWYVTNRYNSSLINPDNSFKQWKDENIFNGFFYHNYALADIGLYSKSWILLDRQGLENNEFSNHSFGGFSTVKYDNKLTLKPYLGYQRAKNISRTDWGWDTGINGALTNQILGDYRTQLKGSSDYDFFENRKNYNNKINASIATQFTSSARDSIKIVFEESAKQFYSSSGEELIEVKLYNRQISNMLFYQLASNKIIKFESSVSSRDIRYFANRKVFFIGSRIVWQHFGSNFIYEIDFQTNDESENNSDIRRDNRSRFGAFGLKAIYYISQKNNIDFNISYSKLQYDTPRENFDDRDEQRLVVDIDYQHKYSPVLSFNISSYGFFLHQIYLFSEQSINNNWNRVLKLTPEVRYTNNVFSNSISSSVLANYTDYDFDYLNLNRRSFLARRYNVQDSLSLRINPSISLGINAGLQFEEKGTFFPEDFSQNVVQSYRSEKLNTFVTKSLLGRFIIRAGYSLYKRIEWRHLPVKRKYREILNSGPYMNFSYRIANRINLSAYTSISYIEDNRSDNKTYNNSYIKLMYYL